MCIESGQIDFAVKCENFVTRSILFVSLAVSVILTILFHFYLEMPSGTAFILDVLVLLLFWHKAYQICCDVKLLRKGIRSKLPTSIDGVWPEIAIVIPSYHEPFAVAKMTFNSVAKSPYRGRKHIIVVDNSRDTSSNQYVQWRDYVEHFTSTDGFTRASFVYNNNGDRLKPGNLDLALNYIGIADYVVIVDVDSTFSECEDVLEAAVLEFHSDNRLGCLQFLIRSTNHHFNCITAAISPSQDLMRLRQMVRGDGGYKIFEGHNGMFRSDVLKSLGAWTQYYRGKIVLAEDVLKTSELYDSGYYSRPLHISTGEWVPNSLSSLEAMWMRWMYGNSQVFFKCFRMLYSERIETIKKFDISYHMLRHVSTFVFFLMCMYLQLAVAGNGTNLFIFLLFVVPQFLGAITSYRTSVHRLPGTTLSKLYNLYLSFFVVDLFIMVTEVKSELRFLFRINQDWNVTSKGIDEKVKIWNRLKVRLFHVLFILFFSSIAIWSWIANYDFAPFNLIYLLGLAFILSNLLACILLFEGEGRTIDNVVETASIDFEMSRTAR